MLIPSVVLRVWEGSSWSLCLPRYCRNCSALRSWNPIHALMPMQTLHGTGIFATIGMVERVHCMHTFHTWSVPRWNATLRRSLSGQFPTLPTGHRGVLRGPLDPNSVTHEHLSLISLRSNRDRPSLGLLMWNGRFTKPQGPTASL